MHEPPPPPPPPPPPLPQSLRDVEVMSSTLTTPGNNHSHPEHR
jgi:hypothetical protein